MIHSQTHTFRNLFSIFFCVFFFCAHSQNTFIKNKGQFFENVISKTNIPGGALFIEKGKQTYAFYNTKQLVDIHEGHSLNRVLDAHAYSVSFLGFNLKSTVVFQEESRFFENYYIGKKDKWRSNVRSYKKQIHKEIYKEIDVIYYVENNSLKYDFVVAKNGDPNEIKMKYTGPLNISIYNGSLNIKTSVNTVIEQKPYSYQIINGIEKEVECNYNLKNNIVKFEFPKGYNENYPLIIDPKLQFSTYSGSFSDNFGYTATYDNLGFLYSGSTVFGVGYPTTLGAYQLNYMNSNGGTDIAITKYDTSGTSRIYSTYLGGTKDELPHSMIVNHSNELFVFGTTASDDFPTTNSAYQKSFKGGPSLSTLGLGVVFPNGSDIFISSLNSTGGDLLSSTFLGGSDNDGLNIAPELRYNYADEVRGEIDIDNNNNVYIATCTKSADFPSINSLQSLNKGSQEGCVVKMDNKLTSIIWSSYIGGSKDDAIYSLAIDKNNNIYVTGGTTSFDFPITTNSYQTTHKDSAKSDAFVSLINSKGTQIMYSSYYGTKEYDQSYFVEIGNQGSVYLFGQTNGEGLTLINNATYFQEGGGQFLAVFTSKLDSVLRATKFGTGKGNPDVSPTAFLVDVCNNIYITGWGSNLGGYLSTLNLPVTDSAYQTTTDGNDFYLMVIDGFLNNLRYATYFGGTQSNEHVDGGTSRFDKRGVVYQSVCAGCGGYSDFPIEPNPGAVSSVNNSGNCNNGVFKFDFELPIVIADFNTSWVSCDTNITFQNLSTSKSAILYYWDFGDGTTSSDENPTKTYLARGNYKVTLIATSAGACNISDTIAKDVYILSNKSDTLPLINKCFGEQKQIGLLPVNMPTITYNWTPTMNLSSSNVSNPFCSSDSDIQYRVVVSDGLCTDTLYQTISIKNPEIDAGLDTIYCTNPILLTANHDSTINLIIWSLSNTFTDTISLNTGFLTSNTGVFYVKGILEECEAIDSVRVKSESLNIEIEGNLELCVGDSVFLKVNNLNPNAPILSCVWNPNDVIYSEDSTNIKDFINTSQWYYVEINNSNECVIQDSVLVKIYEYPIFDSLWLNKDTVFEGEEIIVTAETNGLIDWTGFNQNTPVLKDVPKTDYCYEAYVYNLFGCSIKDSICVSVRDVFCNEDSILIPNAFTPNNDENFLNEEYFIKDKAGVVVEFHLEVFNRLGQKVFFSNNINDYWDGTYMGKKLKPQVLDYYLELKCVGDRYLFKKGNITLIR